MPNLSTIGRRRLFPSRDLAKNSWGKNQPAPSKDGISPIKIGESVRVLIKTGKIVYAATKLSPKYQNPASITLAKKLRRKCFTTSGLRVWAFGMEKKFFIFLGL